MGWAQAQLGQQIVPYVSVLQTISHYTQIYING